MLTKVRCFFWIVASIGTTVYAFYLYSQSKVDEATFWLVASVGCDVCLARAEAELYRERPSNERD